MNPRPFLGGVVAVLTIAIASACYGAATNAEETLDHLPPSIQKTIRTHLAGGNLRSIDTEVEEGDISYDVEMVGRGGRARSFTVGADGELLDKEMFMRELPQTLRQAIQEKAGAAQVGDINRSFESTQTVYEVEIVTNGKTRSFTMDDGGKLVDEEVFLPELPDSFQTAIRKEIGNAAIDDITRSFDDGETSYDVDVIEKGKTRTLTFDSKGVLECKEEDVALSTVPAGVQKQIRTCSDHGKVIAIEKVTEDGAISFDVDIRQGGKVKSYTIAENGEVLDSDPN